MPSPSAPPRIITATPPAWSRNRTLYQVNLRQFTPSGTLREFGTHLPRLADLGVGILWFMPIHPIGKVGRKGTLGSYYAVRDYRRVNPEHGRMRDFDRVVRRANALGLEVLLDWVPNHTAWDHPWVRKHPEWYRRDGNGTILPPVPDWTDVAQLDYGPEAGARETYPEADEEATHPRDPLRPRRRSDGGRGDANTRSVTRNRQRLSPATLALWDEMQSSMEFWIRNHGVAGFRCDVAAFLPLRFWQETRARLARTRDVFLLAEADGPRLHDRAFDATYGWTLQRGLEDVRAGRRSWHGFGKRRSGPFDARALQAQLRKELREYPADAFRMQMTSNHDANSWAGSVFHRLGADGAELGAVLSFVFPGIPLIYNGQEAGSRRRLRFFDKDEIPWGVPDDGGNRANHHADDRAHRREHRFAELYRRLTELKRTSHLLRSGSEGAPLRFLRHEDPDVFAFVRENERASLLAVFRMGGPETRAEGRRRRAPRPDENRRRRRIALSPRTRFPMDLGLWSAGRARSAGRAAGLPTSIVAGARGVEFSLGAWEYGVWISSQPRTTPQ